MTQYKGLLAGGLACLVGGILFYLLAVTGAFFEKATPPNDIGLYAVTAILLVFGLASLFLRWAKLHAPPA